MPAKADCQAELTTAMTGKNVKFETARAVVDPSSFALLDSIADVLTKCAAYRVEVAGHTDPRGDAVYNKDLSQRRSQAVVDYLVAKGVAIGRLTAQGYGEKRLLDAGNTPAALARNRRTEFNLQETGQ
jgi:OmpA-OmpF porin, OOP family